MTAATGVELKEFEVIDATIHAVLAEEPSTARREMLTLLPFKKSRLLSRLRAGVECGKLGCRRRAGTGKHVGTTDVVYWLMS